MGLVYKISSNESDRNKHHLSTDFSYSTLLTTAVRLRVYLGCLGGVTRFSV